MIPDVLNIEDANFRDGAQRQLFAYVVSAKRHVLYSWTDDRAIQLEKCSEHGLGHLMNPLPKGSPEKWPDILAVSIVASAAVGTPSTTGTKGVCGGKSRSSCTSLQGTNETRGFSGPAESSTRLRGCFSLRLCTQVHRMTEGDIDEVIAAITEVLDAERM